VYVNLPERIGPEDLAQRLMDLPGTINVVDIRPAWQFAEYHVSDSVNVPVEQVMNSPVYLNDKRPLVLVCRDGSLSAAVAGALVQKTARPIRFLAGGARRYHDEIMRPAGIQSEAMPLPPRESASPPRNTLHAPASPAHTPVPSAPKPTRKSAGC
jgi:rhodanese-related sulfurtransferase